MVEERSKLDLDSERESAASYERWKNQSIIPFRYSFGGLVLLGAVGARLVHDIWQTPYWPLGVIAVATYTAGALTLFYDIPQRRLSRVSKAFLGLGIAVVLVLIVAGLLKRWTAV